jgi:hypothetical protein
MGRTYLKTEKSFNALLPRNEPFQKREEQRGNILESGRSHSHRRLNLLGIPLLMIGQRSQSGPQSAVTVGDITIPLEAETKDQPRSTLDFPEDSDARHRHLQT